MIGRAIGNAVTNIGLAGHSENGIFGFSPPSILGNYSRAGVYGRSYDQDPNIVCFGVYGDTRLIPSQTTLATITRWSGYFNGNLYHNGIWTPSDEQLKQNMEDLPGALAMEKVMALRPKTFAFRTEEFAAMNLPGGEQYGFGATELQQVLPNWVADTKRPDLVDSTGQVVTPGFTHKVVNYQGMYALLVAAVQEQQTLIAQMQEQLDNCCTHPGTRSASTNTPPADELKVERLVIAPNPFTTHTTVRYHIAQAGRARLEVSNGEGRLLEVLREERTMVGDHTYEWNTSDLSTGTYFVALVVDGNVIVKRAVKVGE